MSTVSFLKGMNSLTKITEMSYPKGTVVKTIQRFVQKPMDVEVVKSKRVYLSPENPLYKAGVRVLQRDVTNKGAVHMRAINAKDDCVAWYPESIKNMIQAIKKYGLKF